MAATKRKLACTINANAVRGRSNLSYESFFTRNFQMYGSVESQGGEVVLSPLESYLLPIYPD